jgi:DNA-binding transcriptional MerR regulator
VGHHFSILDAEVNMASGYYTIRRLTKELHVTARALRFYEDEKLLAPSRRGQTRLYSEQDRARILIVLRGRRLGYTLREMRDVLRMYDYKDGAAEEMAQARRKFVERIQSLEQMAIDVEQSLRQLRGCVQDIDGALMGKPRTPWTEFFEHESVPAPLPNGFVLEATNVASGNDAN